MPAFTLDRGAEIIDIIDGFYILIFLAPNTILKHFLNEWMNVCTTNKGLVSKMDVCEFWARSGDQGSGKLTAEAFIRSGSKGKDGDFRQIHCIICCMCKYFSLPEVVSGRRKMGSRGTKKH